MELTIDTASGAPIYQQITEQICAAIARGRLSEGDRLPSVRELSQALVINPNTVARAYTELEREGTLYTRPGMGVFVSARRPTLSAAERRARLTPSVERVLVEAARLGCTAEELLELIKGHMTEFHWSETTLSKT